MELKKLALDAAPIFARTEFNAAIVKRVMASLIDDGLEGHYSDFAAAEQASMALQSVGAFLTKQGALGNAAQFNAAMKKMNQLLANDEKYQPAQFVAQMKELRLAQIALIAAAIAALYFLAERLFGKGR